MTINISLTKRIRRRKLKSGEIIDQLRYVLNWRDPRSGSREQRFFARQKDAVEARVTLLSEYDRGTYNADRRKITVSEAVTFWLDTKRSVVRQNTFKNYLFQSRYIIGLLPSKREREKIMRFGKKGKVSTDNQTLLGNIKANELTTREIRAWHRQISEDVSVYSANKALMILKAALRLAAEDYEFRPPAMPSGLQRRTDKDRKTVLTPDQVKHLIVSARQDIKHGIYYAAPFLMGTRPSEQLGLLWDAVDFEANEIRIESTQMMDGTLVQMTKTEASRRTIPMSPTLREMLLEWRVRCPRQEGKLERVFPALGTRRTWPEGSGGPLIYNNFRKRIWAPALKSLGLPAATPHSARHSFISILQAQGIEVGLVAQLAGHKNAVVTLSHYTHAMRGGSAALLALDNVISK